MRNNLIILIASLLLGCTAGFELNSVKIDTLFHDSNSKVWIMNQHIVDSVNIAPYNWHEKNLVIFFNTGKVYFVPVKALGEQLPLVGSFYVDSDEKRMDIYINEQNWVLKMPYVSEDSVMLVQTENSEIKQDFQIKPFPEY